MTIRSSFSVFPVGDDHSNRVEVSPAGDDFMLEVFGGAHQTESGEECIGFELSRGNLEELAIVCNALLGKGPAPDAGA